MVSGLQHFNPLPPHGGRLGFVFHVFSSLSISIHSLRMEGDTRRYRHPWKLGGISIHSLRMEGDSSAAMRSCGARISIHSLRMEGDECDFPGWANGSTFQSTPSAWRETSASQLVPTSVSRFQSTPSAWRETIPLVSAEFTRMHFNPLPPHGGRLEIETHCPGLILFQSTPSAWRETNLSC